MGCVVWDVYRGVYYRGYIGVAYIMGVYYTYGVYIGMWGAYRISKGFLQYMMPRPAAPSMIRKSGLNMLKHALISVYIYIYPWWERKGRMTCSLASL